MTQVNFRERALAASLKHGCLKRKLRRLCGISASARSRPH